MTIFCCRFRSRIRLWEFNESWRRIIVTLSHHNASQRARKTYHHSRLTVNCFGRHILKQSRRLPQVHHWNLLFLLFLFLKNWHFLIFFLSFNVSSSLLKFSFEVKIWKKISSFSSSLLLCDCFLRLFFSLLYIFNVFSALKGKRKSERILVIDQKRRLDRERITMLSEGQGWEAKKSSWGLKGSAIGRR